MTTREIKRITAPFTAEQVERLNAFQNSGDFHPFTCGSGNRTDKKHLDGEGVLLATEAGWTCPYCDYTQDWAHDFMAEPVVRVAAIVCMDLLFKFEETLSTKGVTIEELIHVMRLSIKAGHERISLALAMASVAVEKASGK